MYALSDPGRNLLTPRIIRASNASLMTLDGTRTYIVGWESVLVIDPGPDEPAHLDAVALALRGARKVVIAVTHRHDDHAGGVEGLVSRLEKQRADGADEGALQLQVGLDLEDGAFIDTDAGRVTTIATPGHTADHLAFHWRAEGEESALGPVFERDRRSESGLVARSGGGPPAYAERAGQRHPAVGLFVGDLLLGAGDTTLIAWPEGDVGQYLHSLDKLAVFQADRLFPAHGPVITKPDEALRRYRAHRLGRVEQVRSQLKAEPECSRERLTDLVYGSDLPAELRPAAEASVEAIRRYLSTV